MPRKCCSGHQRELALQQRALVAEQAGAALGRRRQADDPDPPGVQQERADLRERLLHALEVPGLRRGYGHREVAGVPEVAGVAEARLAEELPEEQHAVAGPRVRADVTGRAAEVEQAALRGASPLLRPELEGQHADAGDDSRHPDQRPPPGRCARSAVSPGAASLAAASPARAGRSAPASHWPIR